MKIQSTVIHKSIICFAIQAAIMVPYSCKKNGNAHQQPQQPGQHLYELTWQDDFNGNRLDTTNWYHRDQGQRHDGFNDTTSVLLDGNGNLIIRVYSDTINGVVRNHTGMIATKKEFKYGKFEARIAFTNQSGSWSAFWLQSSTMGNPVGNPQAAGMEIDVVETLPNDGRSHENLHWDGYGADHKSAGFITGDLGVNGGNFHVYTLEWTPDYYKFYVDGNLTWTFKNTISQKQEYIILSSEVKNYPSGSWAGPILPGGFKSLDNSKTIMKVDYVKWYKMK